MVARRGAGRAQRRRKRKPEVLATPVSWPSRLRPPRLAKAAAPCVRQSCGCMDVYAPHASSRCLQEPPLRRGCVGAQSAAMLDLRPAPHAAHPALADGDTSRCMRHMRPCTSRSSSTSCSRDSSSTPAKSARAPPAQQSRHTRERSSGSVREVSITLNQWKDNRLVTRVWAWSHHGVRTRRLLT
jgi:hypothetical protein